MKKYLFAFVLILFSFTTAWGAYISYPKFQVFDDDNEFLSGGFVYTYDVGTVDAKTTYSDEAMTAANANPVELDTRGECSIYCAGTVKLLITDSDGTTVLTIPTHRGIITTTLESADGRTKIQTDETPLEDIIRFDIDGTEEFILSVGAITPTTDSALAFGSTTLQFSEAHINTVYGSVLGFVQRSMFTWTDGTTLTITPGVYHHSGVSVQTVYWNSDITFKLGSAATGGSNASSLGDHDGDDLGDAGYQYIYLDSTAIETNASPLLVANCFLNNITAPTYSAAKHGWYTGNDRCIFAVRTDATNVLAYWHDGDRLVQYKAQHATSALADPGTDWSKEVTLEAPGFCRKANVTFRHVFVDASTSYWRNTDTTGQHIIAVRAAAGQCWVNADVSCNSAQKIDIKNGANNDTVGVYTNGFYLPYGM